MEKITQVYKPTKNIGAIYVGSIEDACNVNQLKQLHISFVLTVCIEQEIHYPPYLKITHKVVGCHDWKNFKITDFFEEAFEFMEKARLRGNLLIHCMAGISRSSTLMLGYLMKDLRVPLSKALEYLKRKRPQCRPNPGFVVQLLEYEEKLFGSVKSKLTAEMTPFYKMQQHLEYKTPEKKAEKNGEKKSYSKQVTPIKNAILIGCKALQNSPLPFGKQEIEVKKVKSQSGIEWHTFSVVK